MRRYISPERIVGRRVAHAPKPNWGGAVVSFHKYERSRRLATLLGGKPRGDKILSGPFFPEYPRVWQAEIRDTAIAFVIALNTRADILVEELAYLGVRWIVASGSAGSLIPDLRKGTQVAAIASLPNDGTSRAYGATELSISSNMKEVLSAVRSNVGVDIVESTAATVEAFYREEEQLIDSWRKQGATMINMETSPLYAAALANEVDVIWLGQVSDMLLPEQEWGDWYGDREDSRFLSDRIVVEFVRTLCCGQKG